ncbi:ABC transporter permease [Azospirillum picis]|uniref:ABC-2 type transport system permease protein n=1 Tax=Azospirillum picis TaxID=488438 RepID=A0ABU0MDC1_9PROT|nr:ABC transporter permease [Azospirillum picis]MBP2297721.1 ABC-2 type transport system permease protein [Azospirillum picis]MDQ0531256.1 ABC-2 type transport system permease protein [Azospirillum picis]
MERFLRNSLTLARKEWISLLRDAFMLGFVVYSFTVSVYSQATGISHDLRNAAIAIVDEDRSTLSQRLASAFREPEFQAPAMIGHAEVDQAMDSARFTFVLDIPPGFEADVLAGRGPALQLLIDATAMMQAGIGAGTIQGVVDDEVGRFVRRGAEGAVAPVALQVRIAYNEALDTKWFTGTMSVVSNITMLAVLLAGAALIREREHGTLEHLLVMPVRPAEIMAAKVLANGAVILVMTLVALYGVLRALLSVPLAGSVPLFLAGTALYLFFATALGIFLGTVARSMPQMGLLFILIVLPMNMLSGGFTPLESEPPWLQAAMQLSPSTHFVAFAQAILFRGAGFDVVWPRFAATAGIGALFFAWSLARFRRHLASFR